LAALAVLVIAAAVAVLIALRTTIVAAVLKDRLAAVGLGQVEFRVVEIGLNSARIADVRAASVLKIADVTVGYRLGDLVRGRVATVDIGGLALDVSAIAEWRGGARPATPAALPAALPAIRLRDGRIVGAFPWGSFEVAVAGAVAPDRAATLTFQGGQALVRIADRRLELAEGAGTVTVDAGGAARLVLASGRLRDNRAPVLFPPLTLQGDLALAGDTLDGRMVAEGQDFGRLRLEGTMNLARGEASAAAFLDDVSIVLAEGAMRGASGVVRLERLGPPAALAIRLDRARVDAAGRALAIEDVTARATVALTGTPAMAADIANAVVAGVSPLAVPSLRLEGRVEWRPDTVTFRTGVRPRAAPSSAPVTAEGAYDLGRRRGEARVTAPSLVLGPDGIDLPALVPGLEWIQSLTGAVAGEARLTWSDAGLDGNGRIALNDVSLGTKELWIEAVSGAVQFDRLRPPSAVTAPELRARLISAGVVFEGPSVRLRLEPADGGVRVHVERAETGWAGARFVLKDAILDPAAETQRLALELFKADLATLFRLLDIEGVRGQGILNGRIAVVVGKDSVAIEDGRLEAEGGGILEIRSAAVRRALAEGGEASALLVRALENFHYKRLAVTFQGADDAATARLSVEGVNPDVLDGQPFVVNVNLSGNLGRVLRAILDGYRLSSRAVRATVGKGR
jgi:hypothetical protein